MRGCAADSSTRWVSTKKKSMSDSERACSTPMRSKPGGVGRAVGEGDGVVPEAGGTVAALGRPDAFGVLADVADVGVDGGADLGADGLRRCRGAACSRGWRRR